MQQSMQKSAYNLGDKQHIEELFSLWYTGSPATDLQWELCIRMDITAEQLWYLCGKSKQ